MSKSDTWMPLYIGDYLADTMELNAQEHGAYLLLLMHYWRKGPLPDDDRVLAGIARVDRKVWQAETGPIVRAFFLPKDGKLHQKRLDAERSIAIEKSERRRAAGSLGGTAKQEAIAAAIRQGKPHDDDDGGEGGKTDKDSGDLTKRDAKSPSNGSSSHLTQPQHEPSNAISNASSNATRDASSDATSNVVALLQQGHTQRALRACGLPLPLQEDKAKKDGELRSLVRSRAAKADPEFATFYAAYPKHEASDDGLKAWRQVRATGVTASEIMAGLERHCFKADYQFIPLAASWLRAGRWKDQQPKPSATQPPRNETIGERRSRQIGEMNIFDLERAEEDRRTIDGQVIHG